MNLIDFHCDTLMRLYDIAQHPDSNESLWQNNGQIDVSRLLKSGYAAQFFACFLWLEGSCVKDSFYEDALAMADILHHEINAILSTLLLREISKTIRKIGSATCSLHF